MPRPPPATPPRAPPPPVVRVGQVFPLDTEAVAARGRVLGVVEGVLAPRTDGGARTDPAQVRLLRLLPLTLAEARVGALPGRQVVRVLRPPRDAPGVVDVRQVVEVVVGLVQDTADAVVRPPTDGPPVAPGRAVGEVPVDEALSVAVDPSPDTGIPLHALDVVPVAEGVHLAVQVLLVPERVPVLGTGPPVLQER